MSNADLIERVSNFAPREVVGAVADALEAADKRIAEQAEEISMLRAKHLYTCGTTPPEMYKTELDYAKERIAELEAELERERMRLVACGVVAIADTPDSAKEARKMHPDYESAACSDVARRVDECIGLRGKLAVAREAMQKAAVLECNGVIRMALAQIGEK